MFSFLFRAPPNANDCAIGKCQHQKPQHTVNDEKAGGENVVAVAQSDIFMKNVIREKGEWPAPLGCFAIIAGAGRSRNSKNRRVFIRNGTLAKAGHGHQKTEDAKAQDVEQAFHFRGVQNFKPGVSRAFKLNLFAWLTTKAFNLTYDVLSVLIVNWNTRELLRACLVSLRLHLSAIEHEILVVDCASHDDSAAMVKSEFSDVQLVASMENLGFARGNNLALEHSSGDWVWLLNPDTEVFAGAAQTLMSFLEAHSEVGGVASALIDARDGTFQRSCRTFPTPAALWCEASGLAKLFSRSKRFGFYKMGWFSHRTRKQVEQPMASSFLLRREAIESSGGLFDERFPIFFNDVDLCWRLVQHGWEIWYEPAAKVLHWGGASTKQRRAEMIEESHRALEEFYVKWFRGRLNPALYGMTIALIRLSGQARLWRAR